jgi:hypothetical protein
MSFLDPLVEAAALCVFIKSKVTEYKALQSELDALVASGPPRPASGSLPGPSGIPRQVARPPPPKVMQGCTRSGNVLQEAAGIVARFLGTVTDDDDVGWSTDETMDTLDQSNVDKLLASSVKSSTSAKYGCIWDRWVAFANFHEVEIMPPDVRALEIFIPDLANYSGSSGVALTAAAAITHLCALKGFGSLGKFPRIGKMLRGIRLTHGKAAKPKEPFTPAHIFTFMDLARKGMLREWRAALLLAYCF